MIETYAIRRPEAQESPIARQIREDLGIDVARCLECGKCTGGCSYAAGFDYTPRKIIQLVKLGEFDKLLSLDALWTCLSCQLCVDRCPSGINIPRIMDYLRARAHRANSNITHKNIEKFYEIMLSDIKNRGRISETIMMIKYNLAIKNLFANASFGKKLFLKGKLKFFSPRTHNIKTIQPLFRRLSEKDGQA
ncbi:MAG: 4Fe-4S dicluster domain-containing protein [Desulfovibrio sp.]|jgi:heterodisulfide reductase subunit C|nr:4Fe-4S dicluster domain-containing protein [Desulfovibrio sp.]